MIKKFVESLVITALIMSVVGLYFAIGGELPIRVSSVVTQKNVTFDVVGEATIPVIPDEAVITAGVNKQGATVKEAQDQANASMNNFMARIKAMGIAESDVQTTNYSVYPKYEYNPQRLVGYTVSQNIRISIKNSNFAVLESVMNLVGELSVENLSGLSFQISDELREKTKEEARGVAVENAKKKAESMAKLADIRLGKIVNVAENETGSSIYQPKSYALSAVGGGMDSSSSVAPGSSEVKLSVVLSYDID